MPISCPGCHRDNDPWRRHCGGCGSGLPGGCAACGAVNRRDDKFCGGCGKSLRAVTSVPKPIPKPFDTTTQIDLRDVISETPT